MIVHGQDAKGNSSVKVAKLQNDLKIQISQNEKLNAKKRLADQEITTLTAKVKKLESDLAEKKKMYQTKSAELDTEKTTWENKNKFFTNEIKKKEAIIKKLSESAASIPRDATVINSPEVVGDFVKQGSKFYGSSEVTSLLSAIFRIHGILPVKYQRSI